MNAHHQRVERLKTNRVVPKCDRGPAITGTNEDIVAAEHQAGSHLGGWAIARMMPVEPRSRGRKSALWVMVRPARRQDDGQHEHDPVQLDTEMLHTSTDGGREALTTSATVPTSTSAATRLRVMIISDEQNQAQRVFTDQEVVGGAV